jgi:hypothetical protein
MQNGFGMPSRLSKRKGASNPSDARQKKQRAPLHRRRKKKEACRRNTRTIHGREEAGVKGGHGGAATRLSGCDDRFVSFSPLGPGQLWLPCLFPVPPMTRRTAGDELLLFLAMSRMRRAQTISTRPQSPYNVRCKRLLHRMGCVGVGWGVSVGAAIFPAASSIPKFVFGEI